MTEERIKPLRHFTEAGVAVIATRDNGATLGSWKDPANFTADLEEIRELWGGGYRRFQLHPERSGFIVLDIDRKNGKDGLKELPRLWETADIIAPRIFDNLEDFPAYTRSPSGGLHLYFKAPKGERYKSEALAEGLEVAHACHLITVPGSFKDGKPYIFHGDIQQVPPLPGALKRFLTPWKPPKAYAPPVRWKHREKTHGDMSLPQIREVIDGQGYNPKASRDRYAYELAKFATRKGHPAGSIEAYLQEILPSFPAGEISKCIKSAQGRVKP